MLGDDNPALFSKAFSEEEGAAYAKYWAPGRHRRSIGLVQQLARS